MTAPSGITGLFGLVLPRFGGSLVRWALVTVVGVLAAGLLAACGAPPAPPAGATSAGSPAHLDVLFIGAHPDDESGILSTLGQWTNAGTSVGVVTVTRGEGGGNAVGPEEGPALGLLREGEERAAVGLAGVTDVFNLDKVDFFYTVSAELTRQVWDERDTLARVVRIIRQTRPNVLLTMDPAPTPGNHGNHQEAARVAVEAYYAAADPNAFPEQLTEEGLRPFAPDKILSDDADGTGPSGPACASAFVPADPAQDVFGVWSGAPAPQGRTWAAVERDAQRLYASQGWAGFPEVPTDPTRLTCDEFTQIDSRVPYPAPGTPAASAPDAITAGTGPGAAQLRIEAPFDVTAGTPFQATVQSAGGYGSGSPGTRVALTAPAGWTVGPPGTPDVLGRTAFAVTPPAGAAPGTRVRLTATSAAGYTARQVEVAPPVQVAQQPLPQVAEFDAWADRVDVPWLRGAVPPVLTLPSGGARDVPMTVTNRSAQPRSGTIGVALPPGFTADAATKPFTDLAPGASTSVPFTIRNTDPTLPTANQGGDHAYQLTVTSTPAGSNPAPAGPVAPPGPTGPVRPGPAGPVGPPASTATVSPALELVPATVVPPVATAPVIDGVAAPSEYPGPPLDLSRRWEGEDCDSPYDCSATAYLARSGDVLDVLVQVRDSMRGTALAEADCKRHWRTDSVEIAIDPSGTSENTATTMKLAVLPFTAEGPPCAERDADNHQGPAAETAPGVRFASTTTPAGYTIEAAIPLSALPGPVNPAGLGLDLFVYDSDTQDQTGQTRIGWSTWQGVQGDPYRWGRATLPGYQPSVPVPTQAPVVPREALASTASPSSIEQAVRVHVPLSGGPAAPADDSGWLRAAARNGGSAGNTVDVTLTSSGAGTATVFLRDAQGTAGSRTVQVTGSGEQVVTVPLSRPLAAGPHAIAAWTGDGGTLASQVGIG
jgi:LmbE family N-acetylglucosaminyl deacetylase